MRPVRLPDAVRQSHAAGVAFVLAGAVCWSLGGVIVRLTEGIDAWQIIFYRSLSALVVMGAWVGYLHGGRTLAIIREAGVNAMIAGVAVGLAGLSFVMALFYTTVAQAIFMAGIAPFPAALLGWWILRERVRAATWIAMAIAFVGLGIMLAGGEGGGTVIGIILALYSAFCFSCYSVLLRWGQKTEMAVAVLWNTLFLIAFSAVMLLMPISLREAHGPGEFTIGWGNLALLILMGAVQLSFGMILFVRGSKSVPAAELTLLALIEPTLSPVWAWLAVGEIPAAATLLGGIVIMAAIVVQVLADARRRGAFQWRSKPWFKIVSSA